MFKFIEFFQIYNALIDLILLLCGILIFLSLFITFIFAIIVKYKVIPEIERTYEAILVLQSMVVPGILRNSYSSSLNIFHRYVKSKFIKNKISKITTHNFNYLYINNIKYSIHAEKKINLFLCSVCAITFHSVWILAIIYTSLSIYYE